MRNVAAEIAVAGIVVKVAFAFRFRETVSELGWGIVVLPERSQLSVDYGPGELHIAKFIEGREVFCLAFGVEGLLVT